MEDISKICKGCMKGTAVNGKCAECGFDESSYVPAPHHLKLGTILAGKYMLGKKLGEGGFGITYIGIDLNLGLRVAIKEYFPSGCVARNTENSDTLTVFDGDTRDMFAHGRDKFIEEARTMAQFNDLDGIVSVKDFFLENGTAYIVMEYLDGETLKAFLARNGGRINVNDALTMIKPVLRSLIQLHKAGLIHRDISPDNIMITKAGKVKLIDFGAARDTNPNGNRSLSVQLKPGYAPEEQYRTHGEQGPWTDVYALCATIYRMITGVVPDEANERLLNDTLAAPSSLGISVSANVEAALMQGLSVRAQSRVQSVSELYDAFYKGTTVTPAPQAYAPQGTVGQPPQNGGGGMSGGVKAAVIILAVTAAVAAAALIILLIVGASSKDEPAAETAAVVTAAPTATPAPTPTPVPTPPPPARPDLYNSGFEYKRMPSIHSSRLVSDEEFNALRNVILDFDAKCVDYMNNGSPDVFVYLRAGTTAYDQQTSYKQKHSAIYEVLNSVDVINARTDGGSYYVWVTENMTVTEKGSTKNTVDHWVYRLEPSESGYIIADYTSDPLYKG